MHINPTYLKYAGVFVGSAAIAFPIGYKVAAKRYINYFDQTLETELEGTITFLQGRIESLEEQVQQLTNPPTELSEVTPEENKGELFRRAEASHIQYNQMNRTTPKDVREALETLSAIGKPGEVVVVDEGVAVEVTTENVFEREGVDEDPLDKENRNPMVPYVIDEDEFGVNEFEHDQSSFVYYEGDDILTDQRDDIVTEVEETVGEDNLTKFGAGSRNPNVVHVRNERLGLDFEITRVEGRYSEVAAGFIRHSQDRHEPRRFRGDYE